MNGPGIKCALLVVVAFSAGCSSFECGSKALLPATGSEGYVCVPSKSIRAVRHVPAAADLYIQFRGGNEVVYRGVPPSEVRQFMKHGTGMGGFWRANIRDNYDCDVVRSVHAQSGVMSVYEAGYNKRR